MRPNPRGVRTFATLVTLLAGLSLAGSCSDKKSARHAGGEAGTATAPPATPTPTPAPTTGSAGDRAADSPSRIGEGIGEEAFKALHELPDGQAPAPKGTMVEIAGVKHYLSLPADAKAPMPAVLVIHEWYGLNDHIKHWADRLAAEGYAALAVDLYGGKVATTREDAMKYMQAVDDKAALATLGAAYDFLGSDPRVQASKRAAIGWCFGGGWSLQAAIAKPLDAAVVYYGHVTSDVDTLKSIEGKVLGIFGDRDKGIPPADVEAFDQALTAAGVIHTIHRYDAEHAFANPSGKAYAQPAATDAWEKTRAFLRETIGQ
jgi:carboxymethylenebutenolidase